MYLCHAGILNAYSSGQSAEIITVHSNSIEVEFKAWYSCTEANVLKTALESCFVKRASYHFHKANSGLSVSNENGTLAY